MGRASVKLETPQYIKDRMAALTALAQKGYKAGTISKSVNTLMPFLVKHEGFRPKAYYDKIGKKYTLGHGHTMIPDATTGKLRPVRAGDTISEYASRALAEKRVWDDALHLYKNTDWARYLSPEALAGVLDVSYNAGRNTFSKEKSPTFNAMMNAPDADRNAVVWSQLPTYRTSGGKVIKGLENRRNDAVKAFGPKAGPTRPQLRSS